MAVARSYHCVCTTLIVATNHDLKSLPKRAKPALDQAIILPLQTGSDERPHTVLHWVAKDRKPVVVRREDGFEKRTLLRCKRCSLVVAYKLDAAQFVGDGDLAEKFVYILPGALVETDQMEAANPPTIPQWAEQKT